MRYVLLITGALRGNDAYPMMGPVRGSPVMLPDGQVVSSRLEVPASKLRLAAFFKTKIKEAPCLKIPTVPFS